MKSTAIGKINSLLIQFGKYGNVYQSNIGKGLSNLDPYYKGILKNDIPTLLKDFFPEDTYKIKGSVGQGRVTKTPWITIIDKKISKSAKQGVYLVILFSKNLDKIYFSLAQGVTGLKNNVISARRDAIRNELSLESEYLTLSNNLDIENEEYKNSAIYSNEWNLKDISFNEKLVLELKNAYQKFVSLEDNSPDGKKETSA